jgi:hypothetical protein
VNSTVLVSPGSSVTRRKPRSSFNRSRDVSNIQLGHFVAAEFRIPNQGPRWTPERWPVDTKFPWPRHDREDIPHETKSKFPGVYFPSSTSAEYS